MARNAGDVSRRTVLAGTAVIAAAAVLPSPVLADVSVSRKALPLRVNLPPFGPSPSRVNWCQRIFVQAAIQYETTGDAEDLQRARWTLYWKLGFVMGRIPNSPADKLEQIRGFQMLETVARAYPEVPWKIDLARRMNVYRSWGCDEGRTWESA
jgi:hypothetical protein